MTPLSSDAQRQIQTYRCQYLQLQNNPVLPEAQYLGKEVVQQEIYRQLYDKDAVRYQPPHRYQLRILKKLMANIEASITDWEDEGIYEDLSDKFAEILLKTLPSEIEAAQDKQYVTYTFPFLSSLSTFEGGVPPPASVTILEARNLIASGGTTGRRTWEACLHLASYLSSPTCPMTVKNKNVLELGAGTGLLSILCAKHLGAAHVTATDGAAQVVEDLLSNFYLNGLQDNAPIFAREFWWGMPLTTSPDGELETAVYDVVIGADVTYDGASISALVTTLEDLTKHNPNIEIVISATIRNQDTFAVFSKKCGEVDFMVEDLEWLIPKPDLQRGPFYDDSIPIRICRLWKRER